MILYFYPRGAGTGEGNNALLGSKDLHLVNITPNLDPQKATIAEGIDYVADHIEEGVNCPVCDQHVQLYYRKLNAQMASVAIAMYRVAGGDWVHIPSLQMLRADETKLRYWGLIEARPDDERDDGSPRTGWWRLTWDGIQFVLGNLRVQNAAVVFNGECLRLDGPLISVREALGRRFRYDELMGRAA
ncbi:hypothetical protein [Mycolicibacterium vinylchloridicum]|uniref:hypothetical protein n=1 Tax=Mycolicibacterium vinylchloridicum TaxID=2736928 RepID=UPI0015CB341E|nr:hypothetical protein [Mycolicibacterium vinylchloridicum]